MAFNIDHTNTGNMTLQGGYYAFTGMFSFPRPAQSDSEVVFLAEGAANIDSISGLQSCLDTLVFTNEVGTASTLNAGYASGEALIVSPDGYISVGNLPDSICNNVFVVANTGEIRLLSSAKKGSIAITTNNYGTYVLTGSSFGNFSNWIPLRNPDNCVDSVNLQTGSVQIFASDLENSVYGANVDEALDYLKTGFMDFSMLTGDYVTQSTIDSCLSTNYSTTCWLSDELANYPTTGEVTGCLNYYTNNNGTGALFSPYVLRSTTGDAALSIHNVGTGVGSILCVNSFGFVDDSTIPSYGLTEAFIISSYSDLATLTTASVGDIAIDTVNKLNYILVSVNPVNWQQLSAEEGSLLSVNNHTADAYRLVTISSSDISGYLTGLSANITNAVVSIQNIENTYKTSGSLTGDRSSYVTTSVFNNIASTKSFTGHGHAMSDVSDLISCSEIISPFIESNEVNLEKSYSYQLSDQGLATSSGALIFGDAGKSKNNYEVVQSAGKFVENGDAQSVSVGNNLYVNDSAWHDIITVNVEEYSTAVLKGSFISRNCDAFTLEGAITRESGSVSIADEISKNIYHTGSVDSDVRVSTNSTSFSLQVKGSTWWVANLDYTLARSSSGNGATALIARYFDGSVDNDWYNLSNWWTTAQLSVQADTLPTVSTNVHLTGSTVAYIDMDDASWTQPASIDTTTVSNPSGAILYSNTNKQFSGVVYGNVVLSGNASFR